MIERLFSRTKLQEKALDAAYLRNETIAQNIANVNTPGYKRKTVAFEQYLNKALDENSFEGIRTDKRHIPIGQRDISEVKIEVREDYSSTSMRIDGNNVDIEAENADMAKNTIKTYTLVRSLGDEFRRLRSVISEGRR